MTPLARLLAFPALVLTSLAATAAPVRYALDPVHTRVLFAVEHAGFSKALGTVSGSSGTLVFDPDDWAAATLEVTVPLRRADLGDAKWNEATLARNLLDAERFPDAHFVSTKVEARDATHAKVTGNLTLHGVTRPVTLDVTLNALKRHPLPPFRRTAGFSATATLSRAAFGVDAWKSMIGDTVELRIEAEAVREGRADSDDDAGKPTEPAAPEQPAPATTDTESGR
ncbi:YceI family protein [Xanthomonas campestris pv. raphani]|uniref:YceI family protein n=1 Tax=Xanthomonas campestris TaxID=339 RepID=UPI001E630DA2|nr:YceI family protein [Xanthomonas campestris]MCC8685068.1 YceI family protein [Xanthomonas campestris]MCW1997520.1 polyisoprenoid-binding protein YceI [Xanthomonas campestris]MEA9678832.1 YceI family protein [Xanthomonas campestris pv. raphani]MEA9697364.1 YceI family protein [Xanthomonas campestris pv. raphani]MEA9777970.1 YceI family protein [Xanthomonas campestris pv. raphani]